MKYIFNVNLIYVNVVDAINNNLKKKKVSYTSTFLTKIKHKKKKNKIIVEEWNECG